MGEFKAGHKKVGGRKKGSISKRVKIGRELMESLAANPTLKKKLLAELKELKGKPFVDAMLSVMEFSIPKFNKIDAKQVQVPNVTINLIAAKPKDNTIQTIDITHEQINPDNPEQVKTPRLPESN